MGIECAFGNMNLFNEISLNKKITIAAAAGNVPQTVRLIEVKNHYKVSAIIRGLLSIAIIVTLVAIGILGCVNALVGATFCIGNAAIFMYAIHHNRKITEKLREHESKCSNFHFRVL